jgi:hypothetical protein
MAESDNMIQVTVSSQKLEEALMRAATELGRTRPLLAKLGKSMEVRLRAHFAERDTEGNKHGWPSRHFWNRQVRQNTALTEVTDETATVSIASPPFGLKLFGGTIKPKRGKWLTIPLTAEAYTKGSPREWDPADRQRLFRPGKARILAVKDGKDKGFVPMFALAASVTQDADPRALPPWDEVTEKLGDEATEFVERKLRETLT